jgi:hypothetical protein
MANDEVKFWLRFGGFLAISITVFLLYVTTVLNPRYYRHIDANLHQETRRLLAIELPEPTLPKPVPCNAARLAPAADCWR